MERNHLSAPPGSENDTQNAQASNDRPLLKNYNRRGFKEPGKSRNRKRTRAYGLTRISGGRHKESREEPVNIRSQRDEGGNAREEVADSIRAHRLSQHDWTLNQKRRDTNKLIKNWVKKRGNWEGGKNGMAGPLAQERPRNVCRTCQRVCQVMS